MTAKALTVSKRADKELSRLPLSIQHKIVRAFDQIVQNPLIGPKLNGELENYRKKRVGDYRIIYHFDSTSRLVIVYKIEHRQGVYK